MTEKRDGGPADGGPAFPQPATAEGFATGTHGGMSLRDWFAAHAPPVSDETDPNTLVPFTDEPFPAVDDKDGWALWWLHAEAAYRYAHADALLAARERNNTNREDNQ